MKLNNIKCLGKYSAGGSVPADVLTKENLIGGTDIALVDGAEGKTVINSTLDKTQFAKETDFIALQNKVSEIELFKFPNATIIGSPTINNGQVSGFTSSNYLQFPFIVDVRNLPFEIDFCFTTGNDVTTQQNIIDSDFGLAVAIQNGKGVMALSSNGTSWDIGLVTGTINIQSNTTYYAKVTWDGSIYKTSLSTDGTTYADDMTISSTSGLYPKTMFIGGCSSTAIGHTPHPFLGTINMNYCYLYISGLLVWQGMDDAGLATRADVSLSNIDDAGKQVIKDLASSSSYNGIVSLGFDGVLENNVITFSVPSGEEPYDIKNNFQYELDLHLQVSVLPGTDIDDNTQVIIKNNSTTYQFWSITHTDVSTPIKWSEFKKISTYSASNGYRWLFNATCRTTSSNVKVFVIYPTINKDGGSVSDNVWTKTNLLGGTNITIDPEPVEGGIDEYTIACWHCDNNLIDAKNNIKINQFDVRIDSEHKKFGSSSLRNFERGVYWTDGYTGRFQANISHYGLSTSSNLTVDFWLKLNYRSYYTYSGGAIEYAGFNHLNKNPFGLKWDWNDEEKKVKFGDVLGTDWSNEIQLDNYGEWHHIEYNYEASSKTSRIFFDGNKIKETLLSGVQEFNINYFNLYRDQLNYQPENNADEIRISNTVRHTSNFTPMTQAYSVAEPTGRYMINAKLPTLEWIKEVSGTQITKQGLSSANLLKVYKNGLLLEPNEDYVKSGNTLTFTTELEEIDKITLEVY